MRENIERLSRVRTLVRFDPRGSGLSDRGIVGYSLEDRLRDLDAVVRQLGTETVDCVTGGFGCQLAAHYASRRPDVIRNLVLVNPFVRGADFLPHDQLKVMEGILDRDFRLFTETVGAIVFGWGREEGPRYSRFVRECVNQQDAGVIYKAMLAEDLSSVLLSVTARTLVIENAEGVGSVRSRQFAAAVPGAQYVRLDGTPVEGLAPEAFAAMGRFLGEDWSWASPPPPERTTAARLGAILFTDLEGHSMMMTRLGDSAGRTVLREYERLVQAAITAASGTVVKALGDGFMAWFPAASAALDCAVDIQRATVAQASAGGVPLRVRVGVNAGEPVAEGDDYFGAAVILASRAANDASGGEIVVTDVVRQLVAGKGYAFADRGLSTIKGFDEPVRTWTVRWDSPA